MAPRSLGTRRARPSQPGPWLALSHGNQLGEPRHAALALFLVNRPWAGAGGPQDVPRGHSFCPVALPLASFMAADAAAPSHQDGGGGGGGGRGE